MYMYKISKIRNNWYKSTKTKIIPILDNTFKMTQVWEDKKNKEIT
jgi:hypothetical protein